MAKCPVGLDICLVAVLYRYMQLHSNAIYMPLIHQRAEDQALYNELIVYDS